MLHGRSAGGFPGGLRLQPSTATYIYDGRYQQSPSDTKPNIASYADDTPHPYCHIYPGSPHGNAYPTGRRPDQLPVER